MQLIKNCFLNYTKYLCAFISKLNAIHTFHFKRRSTVDGVVVGELVGSLVAGATVAFDAVGLDVEGAAVGTSLRND